MATRTITPVTAKGYEMLRKHLDHERLNKPVGKITADDVQGWIDDKRGKGTSDNTLNKALNQLKYAYRWGVRMGYLKTNPCDPIKPPKRAHRDPNPLDEENLTSRAGWPCRRCGSPALTWHAPARRSSIHRERPRGR